MLIKDEFKCKCGCGLNNLSESFFKKLQKARGMSSVPFVINSGCRCKEHNESVGGSVASSHLKGLACDILATHPQDRWVILESLRSAGFTRIGVYKTFFHVDIDPEKTPFVIW